MIKWSRLERLGCMHVCLHVKRGKEEIPVQAMKHRKSVFSDSTAKKRVFLGRTKVNRKKNQSNLMYKLYATAKLVTSAFTLLN